MALFLGYTLWQWVLLIIVAISVGLAKTGFSAAILLAVPLLASILPGKESAGLMLLTFIIGDVAAVLFFKKDTKWQIIKSLAPWMIIGVVSGGIVGTYITDYAFKSLIYITSLLCLVLLVLLEFKHEQINVPEKIWFYGLAGVATGFASMVGNLGGPIFALYLLAKGIDKKTFVGTAAVFFFMMNLIKLPIQFFSWHNYSLNTLFTALAMGPFLIAGVYGGKRILSRLNEKVFRTIIIIMTAVVSLKLLIFN